MPAPQHVAPQPLAPPQPAPVGSVPAHVTRVNVVVPPNVQPGQLLRVQTASGLVQCTVPKGVGPGQTFVLTIKRTVAPAPGAAAKPAAPPGGDDKPHHRAGVKVTRWTQAEDDKLKELVEEHGACWRRSNALLAL